MKTIAKLFSFAMVLIFALSMMTGCNDNSTKAYTFSVDNGDSIKVSLNTMDNYDISSELPFTITCNGELQSQGTFILGDAFAQYKSVVENDEKAEMIDSGEKDGNEYIFWCYNGSEYNYAILIADSNTGIVLGNVISEESAKECFDRLTISVSD